jgi:hypothetical protein
MFDSLEILIHVANVLYLLALLVRDILWLRILMVAASFFLLPYFYLQPSPLMTPIYWNLAFTSLNTYWIVRLCLERRPIQLNEEELRLCELVFRTMKPREMMKILRQGTWRTAEVDECLVNRGHALDELMVIYSGKACVEVDGKYVTELHPGQFIGGISYITDETAPANVVAIELTRYFVWPISKLKSFLSKNPDLHAALQTTLAIDFTKWLHGSWARHPT